MALGRRDVGAGSLDSPAELTVAGPQSLDVSHFVLVS